MDLFNYFRRETSEVNIGAVPLGGPNPIRIQSMTNTSTMDTESCVEQAKRIVDAGGEYVRLTTQGVKGSGKSDEYQYRATKSGIYGSVGG